MSYDFIFINNGEPLDVYSFQGTREIFIWSKEKFTPAQISKIEKACPKILKGDFKCADNLMCNYLFYDEDEIVIYYAKQMKNFDFEEQDFPEIYKNFAKDIENFAIEVNKIAPLFLFIGIERICGSKWDKWSIELINEVITGIENETGKSAGKASLLNSALELLYQRHGFSPDIKTKIKKLIK